MATGHGAGRPPLLTSTKTVPNVMAISDPTTIPEGCVLRCGVAMYGSLATARQRPLMAVAGQWESAVHVTGVGVHPAIEPGPGGAMP